MEFAEFLKQWSLAAVAAPFVAAGVAALLLLGLAVLAAQKQ